MPLDKIVEKIKGDAQAEANALTAEAQAAAKKYTNQAKVELEAQCKQLLAEGKEQASREKQQQLQIATLDIRKQVLAEKQALIAKVFEQALQELQQLDKEKYTSILKNMLTKYPLEGDEEIIVSKSDRQRLGDGFITQLNQELKKQKKKGSCKWAEEQRPLKGGFIIRRGKIEANYSFESLLKSQQEELEQEVAQILFA